MQIIDFDARGAQALTDSVDSAARSVADLSAISQRARLSLNYLSGAGRMLKTDMNRLQNAFSMLAAPLVKEFLPVVRDVFAAVTGFVTDAAVFIARIFGYSFVKTEKKAVSTGKTIRRSLADFDQLQRLNGASGGSGGTVTLPGEVLTLPDWLAALADKLHAALEPVKAALSQLKITLAPLLEGLGIFFAWVLENVVVPVGQWLGEKALPAFLQALGSALLLLGQVILVAQPTLMWLFETYLKPLGQWTGETVVAALEKLAVHLDALGLWIQEHRPLLQFLFQIVTSVTGAFLLAASAVVAFFEVTKPLAGTFTGILVSITALALGIQWVAEKLAELKVEAVLSMEGVREGFSRMLTGCITLFNTVASGAQNAVNAMIRSVNGISLAIPDWVPGYGGKRLGFSLRTVSFPRIPQLARGAVLPPNRPFLAMVGDQKSGTNIEAPLSTIQEAVALTMEELSAGNMAGHAATVEALERLLDAVCGIRIGDETIANACDRHRIRSAMMKGA